MSKFIWDEEKQYKVNLQHIAFLKIVGGFKGDFKVDMILKDKYEFPKTIARFYSKEKAQEFIDDLTRDELQENIERTINLIERKIYGQI